MAWNVPPIITCDAELADSPGELEDLSITEEVSLTFSMVADPAAVPPVVVPPAVAPTYDFVSLSIKSITPSNHGLEVNDVLLQAKGFYSTGMFPGVYIDYLASDKLTQHRVTDWADIDLEDYFSIVVYHASTKEEQTVTYVLEGVYSMTDATGTTEVPITKTFTQLCYNSWDAGKAQFENYMQKARDLQGI